MNPVEITAAVTKIFAARGRTIEPQITKVWIEGIIEFCAEKKVPEADIRKGMLEYFRSADQFPVLGQLLERIKPQAGSKSTRDREERIIDEYSNGNRPWDKVPHEVRDAINAVGGVFAYRSAESDYKRQEWLKRYHAAREIAEQGYTPEKRPTRLLEASQATPDGTKQMTEEAIRANVEKLANIIKGVK